MEDDIIKLQLGEKSPQFKRILKIASNFLTDAELKFSEDQIRINESDPAAVALVDIQIDKEWFNTEKASYNYNLDDEQKNVGVNLENLEDTLKGSTKDEQVEISYGETRTGQRTWESLVGKDHKDDPDYRISVKRESNELSIEEVFPEKDLDTKTPAEDLEFGNKMEINAQVFKKVVQESKRISESVRMKVNEEKLEFSSTGDYSNIESTVTQESFDIQEFVEATQTILSLSYLKKLVGKRLDAVSDTINIRQADDDGNGDFPVMFTAESDNVKAEILVAPRIPEEE